MGFPQIRMRRLRTSATMRRMVRETAVSVDDLIYPLFVRAGEKLKKPIASMTDCFHLSADLIADEAEQVAGLGIPAVLLFGLPEKKDEKGSEAWSEAGPVQEAIRQIKKRVPDLLVVTDVCLCEYTSAGHCGVVKDGKVDNDTTCELLAKMALSHAQAGADIVHGNRASQAVANSWMLSNTQSGCIELAANIASSVTPVSTRTLRRPAF